MHLDDESHEQVVSYQSRQLRLADRNYSNHDKELLEIQYPLIKFRMDLPDEKHFAIYTDHTSL